MFHIWTKFLRPIAKLGERMVSTSLKAMHMGYLGLVTHVNMY